MPLTATPRSPSASLWLGNALPRLGAAVAAQSGRIGAPYEADPASVQAVLRSLAAPAPATCNLFLQIGPVSDTPFRPQRRTNRICALERLNPDGLRYAIKAREVAA